MLIISTVIIGGMKFLFLNNVAPLRDVQTVQELTDILVLDEARLLDISRGLRDILDAVAGQLDLVLDTLGGLDRDTLLHGNVADDLLAQEVSNTRTSVIGHGLVRA